MTGGPRVAHLHLPPSGRGDGPVVAGSARGRASAAPEATVPHLAREQAHEPEIRHEIPPDQPAWLLSDAPQPFEPGPLHEPRGPAHHAGKDVDRAADAHHDRRTAP